MFNDAGKHGPIRQDGRCVLQHQRTDREADTSSPEMVEYYAIIALQAHAVGFKAQQSFGGALAADAQTHTANQMQILLAGLRKDCRAVITARQDADCF